MRLADHSVSLKALPVNALIGLEQTTRFTGGHDCLMLLYVDNIFCNIYQKGSILFLLDRASKSKLILDRLYE